MLVKKRLRSIMIKYCKDIKPGIYFKYTTSFEDQRYYRMNSKVIDAQIVRNTLFIAMSACRCYYNCSGITFGEPLYKSIKIPLFNERLRNYEIIKHTDVC